MLTSPSPGRRRFLLTGGAALVPASFGSRSAAAQEVPVERNAGHYRFRVGDIKATVVSDGTLSGSVRIYAGSAPADDLQRALAEAFLPSDNLTINLNTLLLEIGDRKILVEAGAAKTMGPNGGALFANLAAIGVRPEQIDAVEPPARLLGRVSHSCPATIFTWLEPL